MIIKKIVSILISISLCVSLTACSTADISETTDKASNTLNDTYEYLKKNVGEGLDAVKSSAQSAQELASKWTTEVISPTAYEFFNSSKEASLEAKDVLSSYYDYCKENGPDAEDLKGYLDSIGDAKDKKFNDLYALIGDSNSIVIPDDHMEEAKDYLAGKSDVLTAIDDDESSQYTGLYRQSMESLKKRMDDPSAYSQVSPTYGELLAAAQMCKDGDHVPEDFGISMSSIISPKYVLKQAVGTYLGADSMNTVLKIGPQIYGILKEELQKEGVDESTLEKDGLAAAIASSGGAVEGSVSKVLQTMLEEDDVDDSDPSVISTLTFLAIEGAIHGYDLSKGVITPEEYGDIMAEALMTSLLSLPSNSILLAVLPSAQVTMIAGCMAGGMLVCMGYDESSTQEAAMDMINGGGFEAIVPADQSSPALSLTEKIFNVTTD